MRELDALLLEAAEGACFDGSWNKDEIFAVLKKYTFLEHPNDEEVYPDFLDHFCSQEAAVEELRSEIQTAEKEMIGIDHGRVVCEDGARVAILVWIAHAKLFLESHDRMKILFASSCLRELTADSCRVV
eukprot:7170052-Karenia_brevis.AAC.1